MGTRLYATNAATPSGYANAVYTATGNWTLPASAGSLAINKLARAANWPGLTAFSQVVSVAEDTATPNPNVAVRRFVSDAFAGDQTIAGTLKGQMALNESAAGMNAFPRCVVKVVSNDGTVLRGTLYAGDNRATNVDEVTTSVRNWKVPAAGVSPVTLTPVDALDGDRIVVEVGVRAINSVATSFTSNFRAGSTATPGGAFDYAEGGSETGVNLNAWFEFSQDLWFDPLVQSQEGFRFYNDDAGETAATPLGALNANVSVPAGTNFRWRARAKSSSRPPVQGTVMRPYYSLNGGAWTQVGTNADTTVVDARRSPHFTTADTTTTERLTGTGTFNPGTLDNVNASGAAFQNAPALNDATEMEYCLHLNPAAVTPGDTIDLRLYSGTVPLNSYAAEARVTVLATTTTLPLTGATSDEIPGVLLPQPGAVSMGVPGASTEELTGTLAAVGQATTLALVGATTDESSGALTAAPQSRTLALTGQGTDETTGTLTAVPQTRTIALTGLASDETTGALTAAPQTRTVALAGQGTDETAGTLTVAPQPRTVVLTGLSSEETTGTLTVQAGATTRPLTGPGSDESAGTLVAVPQPRTLPLTGLSGDETTGSLITTAGTATRLLVGANTEELPGSLSVSQPAANTIPLTGAASDELAGNLLVQPQTASLPLTGRGTDELPGTLVAVPQPVTVALTGQGTDELPGTVTPTQVPPNNIALVGVGSDELPGSVASVALVATLSLTGATTDELPGTLVSVGEGPPVTTVPLTGASSDEIAGTITPVPGPATVVLVGAETDELPGRPYEPEAGTPPLPVIRFGIVERPCATVGVRDPPRALIGVAERPRARVGVVEQDETSVTIGVRDTPGALLGVR